MKKKDENNPENFEKLSGLFGPIKYHELSYSLAIWQCDIDANE